MTLIDIKNALLSHFISYSVFDLKEDLRRIKTDPSDTGFTANLEAITLYGLQELVKINIIAQVTTTAFVLIQPVTQLSQTVVVDPFTALMLADLVNGWTETSGEQKETGYVVNKLGITNKDIYALCQITATLLSSDDEPMDRDGDEEGDRS